MKMQNAIIEIIKFNSIDVIATSGKDYDDSTVGVIWLTPQSITNYNAMVTGVDKDVNLYVPGSGFNYYAYSGMYINGLGWMYSQSQNEKPKYGIREVAAGDETARQAILSWLKENYTY